MPQPWNPVVVLAQALNAVEERMAEREIPYPSRNIWKAELRWEGDAIVKDYGPRPYHARLLGRMMLSREELGLRRLTGIPGVPAFLGRPTPDSIRMQAVPGYPVERMKRGDLTPEFIENLKVLFARMHARGVAHGDAHLKNILADGDTAFLVDFSVCYVRPGVPVLDGYLFRRFRQLDLGRLYKTEKRFVEGAVPPKMFLLYRLAKLLKPRHRHRHETT